VFDRASSSRLQALVAGLAATPRKTLESIERIDEGE
jgi:hypothetical protein